MEYTSKGVGNAALATGIIGTTLGALDGMGGLAGLFGNRRPPVDPGDKPVTRYEMDLIKESLGKDTEISLLKSQQYTDKVNAGVQGQIAAQNAWNAAQAVNIQNIQGLLDRLVQPCIPNGALNPGYGIAQVFPPAPPIIPTASSTTITTGTGG